MFRNRRRRPLSATTPKPSISSPGSPSPGRAKVTLRQERNGADHRWLGAYLDDAGSLHIDGQDLGPGTAPVSGDGEYEWFQTIAAGDVPRLVDLLGGEPDTDILELLAQE